MSGGQCLRVFISSPGDVRPERLIAERVVNRLDREFAYHFRVEPVLWEREPLVASHHFQEKIIPPSETDIVVVILWSRLGFPLPAETFVGAVSGTTPVTGTEWEFEEALKSCRERSLPDLLMYRKKAESTVRDDEAAAREHFDQKRRVEAFMRRWFLDGDAQSFTAAFREFSDAAEFEDMLEIHLRQLLRARLEESGDGAPPPSIRWHQGSPFRGLLSFELEHAPVFFGRARARTQMRELLARQAERGCAFVLVVGASGSGKSSLVKAGLLPDLILPGMIGRVALVRHAVMKPSDGGDDPLMGLATAILGAGALPELTDLHYDPAGLAALLAAAPAQAGLPIRQGLSVAGRAAGLTEHGEARLLLIVDQMEELFTQESVTPASREAFVAALAALANCGEVWVVGTLRSDFFDRVETLPGLADLSGGEARYLLMPPEPAEIGQIIVQPARAAGLRFETDPTEGSGLDEAIRAAAVADPGALPLLSFLLDQLWQRRDESGMLTFAAYRALGGLEGALGRRAEAVFTALRPDIQAAFPQVLRALVAMSSAGRATARRASLAGFPPDGPAHALIEALLAPEARLLVADGDGLRVAHEALLSHWERARAQIVEDREDLELRGRLELAVALWSAAPDCDRPSLRLPPGRPLSEAEDLLARRGDEIDPGLAGFIRHSGVEARAAERRRLNRLRVTAAGLAFLALCAAGFGAWGWDRSRVARDKLQQAQIAQSRYIAEMARDHLERDQPELAWAIALEGVPVDPAAPDRPVVAETERQAMTVMAQARERLRLEGMSSEGFAFSPAGDRVAVPACDNTVRILDVATGIEITTLRGHHGMVFRTVFSPAGDRIVTASFDGTARVWEVASGTERAVMGEVIDKDDQRDRPRIVIGPKADRVALVFGPPFFARMFDLATGQSVDIPLHVNRQRDDLYSSYYFYISENHLVAEGAFGSHAVNFNGEIVWRNERMMRHPVYKSSIDGSVDYFCYDGGFSAIDHAGGETRVHAVPGENVCHGIFFTARGGRVVFGSDTELRVVDLDTGIPLFDLATAFPRSAEVDFSPSGDQLVTASEHQLRLWDGLTGTPIATPNENQRRLSNVLFSPRGDRLLTADNDGLVRVWSVPDRTAVLRPAGDGDVGTASLSPAFDRLVYVDSKTFRVGAGIGGGEGREGRGRGDRRTISRPPILPAAFSPRREPPPTGVPFRRAGLLVSEVAQSARILDIRTGRVRMDLLGHQGAINSVRFGPTGETIVTASFDRTARVWDAATGASIAVLEGHAENVNFAAFDRTGQRVVTASSDRTARVWDAATGGERLVLRGHTEAVIGAAFNSAGDRLVTGATDKTARVWDAATGAPIAILSGHAMPLTSVAISASGDRVLTASADGAVGIWDVNSGKVLGTLGPHETWIGTLGFSPSGDRAVTTTADGTIRVWDIRTGALLHRFQESKPIIAFAIDERMERLVTVSLTKAVHSWDVATSARFDGLGHADMMAYLHLASMRDLTAADRQTLFLGETPPADPALRETALHHQALAARYERGVQGGPDLKAALRHHALAARAFAAAGDEGGAIQEGARRAMLARALPPAEVAPVWREVLSAP